QAPREPYPPAWAVARFRELGGRRVTTGSDSHRAAWFGLGLADVYRIVGQAGFEDVWVRRGATSAHVRADVARVHNARPAPSL
ncbi:MAG TPA: hypothetical protein VEY67_01225, partial [Candidatus Dormibacteraeota bacterium]|nr:hypothetical protein [Candidatus Dormibacteraeota bacterium]